MDTYTQALQKSLEQWAERIGWAADTLYLGGGTPPCWVEPYCGAGANRAGLLWAARRGDHSGVQPFRCGWHLFEALAGAGVSRISLGLQSAVDEERKAWAAGLA